MVSDPQANSRNSTRNVINRHPSPGGSFAFARLRCHRLLATDLVNERIIAEARFEENPTWKRALACLHQLTLGL